MKMTSTGARGFAIVDSLEEAEEMARSWGYDNFILDGVEYVLFDGKYRRVEERRG